MPKPPAAFSPLTMTTSSFQSAISPGSRSCSTTRPLRPTTSPTKRTRMLLPAAIDQFALGEHHVEPRIARRERHHGNVLRMIGKPDRDHGLEHAKPIDGEVVIAGAIADTVALAVEGRERDEQDIRPRLRC